MEFRVSRTSSGSYYSDPKCDACKEVMRKKEKCYVVELNSLEDLQNFCAKYGKVIVTWHKSTREIEIYDDWRE